MTAAAALVPLGSVGAAATTEPAAPAEVAAASGTPTIPPEWLDSTPDEDWAQEDPNMDCSSMAVRRPGCGSKDRGGWHQTVVLGAVLAGLAIVVGRIAVAMRRPGHQGDVDDDQR